MKWLLIAFFIFLTVLNPAAGFFGIFDNFFKTLQKKVGLAVGLQQFSEDIERFSRKELKDTLPKENEEYDFIIVGAGSAGSTIASRLSEIEDVNILLIEAGGHEDMLMNVPGAAIFLYFDEEKRWSYLSDPSDDYCRGIINRQCRVQLGKVMGGTSSLNLMLATRGNKKNYDTWANMTGDDSWSYEEMLKYYKKLETADVFLAQTEAKYRNFNGPVRIGNVKYRTPLAKSFTQAGEELGLPPLDYNGRKQTGFSYIQTNQVNGERLSANRAYLHPIKNRKNLFVSMNSHVNKVLIDPKSKTAYGVEFTKGNRIIRVKARKEVILSAGAIGSPKILMLSGIGPSKHLQSFNINVLQDAPVGENLMDHITYGGLSFSVNDSSSHTILDVLKPDDKSLNDFFLERKGLLTTPDLVEGLGYANVDDLSANNEDPNTELIFIATTFGFDYLIHSSIGIDEKYYQKSFAPQLYRYGYMIWPTLMQPKSRGKVLLRSANPKINPRIIPNYFSHPDDVRVGVKSIRLAIEVGKTRAMRKHGSTLNPTIIPGCEQHKRDSDAYWECAFRTYTLTLWHHSGTCKMGRENDPTAVVNSKLQVKGIKRLRVADTSVMPMVPTAHTNIPTIALAEKFSDMIKSDWSHVSYSY